MNEVYFHTESVVFEVFAVCGEGAFGGTGNQPSPGSVTQGKYDPTTQRSSTLVWLNITKMSHPIDPAGNFFVTQPVDKIIGKVITISTE